MNEPTKQYILRKPVSFQDINDWLSSFMFSDEGYINVSLNELFVEFDEDLLRQQIRSEIDKAILRALTEFAEHVGYEETIQYESIYEADCADAVLALIVGEKS